MRKHFAWNPRLFLGTHDFLFGTHDFFLRTHDFFLGTHDFLPTTFYPRPTTFYPRPTTFYPRPTTFYPRPTTHDCQLVPLFSHEPITRIEPTMTELKGACSEDSPPKPQICFDKSFSNFYDSYQQAFWQAYVKKQDKSRTVTLEKVGIKQENIQKSRTKIGIVGH